MFLAGRSATNPGRTHPPARLRTARPAWCPPLPAAAVLLAVGACQNAQEGQGRGGGAAVTVRTAKVQRMSIQRQIDLAGTLLSPDQARVSSEAAGVVRKVLVEIGRPVAGGTPLVPIE